MFSFGWYDMGIFICEYIIGFASVFGACITIDKVFGYRIKKYFLFSIISSIIHPTWLILTLRISFLNSLGPSVEGLILLYSGLTWLFITSRNAKELVISFSAMVFSLSIAFGTSTELINIIELFYKPNIVILILFIKFVANIISVLFIILIAKLAKNKLYEPLSIRNIILLAFISYVSTISVNYDTMMYGEFYKNTLSVLGFVFIITSVILSVRNLESKYYERINRMNENYLNIQENYYDSKRKADTDIRRIRHDIKNHLLCINELCKNKEYDELSEYISSLSDQLNQTDSIIINSGSSIADAIISDKKTRTTDKNIDIIVNGSLENCNIAPIDLCTILANLLDNSIEAVEKLPVEKRKIEVSFKQNTYFIFISVLNETISSADIEVTTKDDKINHGFGIYNIRKAVRKYNGEVNFSCSESNSVFMFNSEIMLPKINN